MNVSIMETDEKNVAALVYGAGDGEAADSILDSVANEVQLAGYKIAGTVQRSVERSLIVAPVI